MYYARKAVINDSFPGIFVSGKTLVLSFFGGMTVRFLGLISYYSERIAAQSCSGMVIGCRS